MTILDIAQSMKGRLRDGLSPTQSGTQPNTSEVSFGTATADSSGGFVTILMDGAPVGEPGYDPADYTFEVACDSPISANDRVAYIADAGRGKAVSTATLSQIASDADAIANATNQHFWADSGGVHVSTDESDADGAQNIVMNSAGVLLREGSDYLAAFTPSAVAFYDGNGNTSDNITASFGTSGAIVGKAADGESRVEVLPSGMTVVDRYQGNDATIAEIVVDSHRPDGVPIAHYTFGERGTRTIGDYSFVSGAICDASGNYSFATGHGAASQGDNQTSIGRYNALDSTSAFIIGNGYDEATRSNALTVDWNGNITAGNLSIPVSTATSTTAAQIITAGTYITVTGAEYSTWGKVAQLLVTFTRSSAISANQNFTVGTVASGKRPVHTAGGSSNSFVGWLTDSGTLTVRNVTGAQIAANTTVYISFTYLLP